MYQQPEARDEHLERQQADPEADERDTRQIHGQYLKGEERQ